MTWSIILAAAKPWTYWLAPALLIAALVLIAGIAIGYYRRVAVPAFQWRLHEEQRRLAEARRQQGSVRRLPQRGSSTSVKAA